VARTVGAIISCKIPSEENRTCDAGKRYAHKACAVGIDRAPNQLSAVLLGRRQAVTKLCGNCYLEGVCERRKAIVPSLKTVQKPIVRLEYQNWLVGLAMPYGRLIDFHLDTLRDFNGSFRSEKGEIIGAPGIGCILNPGAEFWFRDLLEDSHWGHETSVPNLRFPAAGRWVLIGTVKHIRETNWPLCPRT
jgi:hypothetical protein